VNHVGLKNEALHGHPLPVETEFDIRILADARALIPFIKTVDREKVLPEKREIASEESTTLSVRDAFQDTVSETETLFHISGPSTQCKKKKTPEITLEYILRISQVESATIFSKDVHASPAKAGPPSCVSPVILNKILLWYAVAIDEYKVVVRRCHYGAIQNSVLPKTKVTLPEVRDGEWIAVLVFPDFIDDVLPRSVIRNNYVKGVVELSS